MARVSQFQVVVKTSSKSRVGLELRGFELVFAEEKARNGQILLGGSKIRSVTRIDSQRIARISESSSPPLE